MLTKRRDRKITGCISRLVRFKRATEGTAVIEFAFLAPVLFLLLIGMFQFGILINNYIQLTEAVRVAGRTLAISRGSATPITDTKNAIFNSAPGLTQGSIQIFMTVNGTACSSTDNSANNTACKNLLAAAQGMQAVVTATYNCTDLIVYGTNFMPGCSLSSTTSGRIE